MRYIQILSKFEREYVLTGAVILAVITVMVLFAVESAFLFSLTGIVAYIVYLVSAAFAFAVMVHLYTYLVYLIAEYLIYTDQKARKIEADERFSDFLTRRYGRFPLGFKLLSTII